MFKTSKKTLYRNLGFVSVLGTLFVGCADDLYAPCQLDPQSGDQAVRECGLDQQGSDKSCVVENQVQCDTRVCGRYQGSAPFCTQPCSSDSDCSGGVCVEFVFQSGVSYCVENILAQ